ncbi:MAG: hypothetical protein R2788_19895 [Saprospiraceae bacterium]
MIAIGSDGTPETVFRKKLFDGVILSDDPPKEDAFAPMPDSRSPLLLPKCMMLVCSRKPLLAIKHGGHGKRLLECHVSQPRNGIQRPNPVKAVVCRPKACALKVPVEKNMSFALLIKM